MLFSNAVWFASFDRIEGLSDRLMDHEDRLRSLLLLLLLIFLFLDNHCAVTPVMQELTPWPPSSHIACKTNTISCVPCPLVIVLGIIWLNSPGLYFFHYSMKCNDHVETWVIIGLYWLHAMLIKSRVSNFLPYEMDELLNICERILSLFRFLCLLGCFLNPSSIEVSRYWHTGGLEGKGKHRKSEGFWRIYSPSTPLHAPLGLGWAACKAIGLGSNTTHRSQSILNTGYSILRPLEGNRQRKKAERPSIRVEVEFE